MIIYMKRFALPTAILAVLSGLALPAAAHATTTQEQFTCPSSQGLFANPDDPASFYHCDHGVAYRKDCPSILHFNPVLLVCDWPEHAGNPAAQPESEPNTA
ncbi:carbohydrate-binding module family 14 protein [Streptomyces xanthophaeus]